MSVWTAVLSAKLLLLAFNASAAELIWRGDQCTARAFVTDLTQQFAAQKQGKFILQPFSTISGLDAVHAGTADLAGSARPAMPNRLEEAGLHFYPIAYDALVAITSAKNPVDNLSLKQLRDIYLGKISNWKDLNGPDLLINVYAVAGPLDGIEYSTRLLLFKNGDQRVAAPRLYVNTEKLEEGITLDPAGLGLSTLSGVYANKMIKMLSIEGVAASNTNIMNGSYPLYSPLYLVTRENGAHNNDVQHFLDFLQTPKAQETLRRHQLVPYASATELANKQDQQIAFIETHLGSATADNETPVSAPIATAEAKIRVAPTAPSTQKAKQRAAKTKTSKTSTSNTQDARH